MSADAKTPTKEPVFQPKVEGGSRKPRNFALRVLVAVTLVGALGGAGWWWFFGSKPRVIQTIAIAAEQAASAESWRAGEGEVALLAGGKLTMVNLKDGQQRWAAVLPLAADVDGEWQVALAKRFLKLQRWADELTAKRGDLKGAAAVKAFNADAAKYAAELAAVRADSSRRTAPPKPVVAATPPAKRAHGLGEDRSDVDKLNTVRNEEEAMLRARIAKRTAQLSALRASIAALGAPAGNAMKVQQVGEQARKLKSLEQEQKADESALAPKPVAAVALPARAAGAAVAKAPAVQRLKARFAVLGEFFWLSEGTRVIGFDRVSGSVKRTIPMPGPVVGMVEGTDSVSFVARVGASIRYAVNIGADGRMQTVYMPFVEEWQSGGVPIKDGEPGAAGDYSEVFGGGTLALASVHFAGKKDEAVQPPDSADASVHRVSVRRPFASGVPAWQGELPGRVQCFSTADISLVTGGKKLVALNSSNAKLWEVALTAPVLIGDRNEWDAAPGPPCLAVGDRLYFSDRAGLTAFNMGTGEVVWRLSSIGIRKVAMDGDGFLYVQSANLPIDTRSRLALIGIGEQSVVMKVNPADGMPVWTQDKLIDVWASGKDVYALGAKEARSAQDAPGFPSIRQPGILKLSRRSGKQWWEWSQPLVPSRVFPMGKTLAVFYGDGLQLIHSTAL